MSMPIFTKPTQSRAEDALVSVMRAAASGMASGAALVCAETHKIRALTAVSNRMDDEDAAADLLVAVDESATAMTRALASRDICVSNMLADAVAAYLN